MTKAQRRIFSPHWTDIDFISNWSKALLYLWWEMCDWYEEDISEMLDIDHGEGY